MPFYRRTRPRRPRRGHRTPAPGRFHHHGRQRARTRRDGKVDTACHAQRRPAGSRPRPRAGGRSWPGLIGVDQEGGVVARLRAPLTEWPAPMSYGAAGSGPLAADAGRAMASELAALGFNANFAPTTDVTMGPPIPTIGARSMSGERRTRVRLRRCLLAGDAGRRAAAGREALSRPRFGQRRFPCQAARPGAPASAQLRAKDLVALPGRHRRRTADGHGRPHRRAGT